MKNYRKGQAAMEYLMTYGWALLAIVIVIAALIYLNPFRAPELCLFQQQGFSCSEPNPQLYSDGGDVSMNVRIWNKLGKTVKVHGVLCTNAQVTDVALEDANEYIPPRTIPTGSSEDFLNVDCRGSDGVQVQMQANEEFRGKMLVWYNYVDDINENIKHEAQANVISVVVEGEDALSSEEPEPR